MFKFMKKLYRVFIDSYNEERATLRFKKMHDRFFLDNI